MGTVDNASPIKSGYYGDSVSGEVSLFDLQKNVLVDRSHGSFQIGDYQDPTNFIRSKIGQTLHMRPTDRPPVPTPRRTFDGEKTHSDTNGFDGAGDLSIPTSRSPDVSALRGHMKIGGATVKLRNPHRLPKSSPRSVKTMSWMERPSVKFNSNGQRRHSNMMTDKNFMKTLKKMEQRKTMIETGRMKKSDRRDLIENEKRLREDLWSNDLLSLQQELDAALSTDDISNNSSSPKTGVFANELPPRSHNFVNMSLISVNNNNNKGQGTRSVNLDSTYLAEPSSPLNPMQHSVVTPSESNMSPGNRVDSNRRSKELRKTLFSENFGHSEEQLTDSNLQGDSNTEYFRPILDGSESVPAPHKEGGEPRFQEVSSTQSFSQRRRVPSQHTSSMPSAMRDTHQPTSLKSYDLLTPNAYNSCDRPSMLDHSLPRVSSPSSNRSRDRFTPLKRDDGVARSSRDTSNVVASKAILDHEILGDSGRKNVPNVSSISTWHGGKSVLQYNDSSQLLQQENLDPNQGSVKSNLLSTYNSFSEVITEKETNKSTPYQSPSRQLNDPRPSPEKGDNSDSPSSLLRTADRNRKGGEGFELIDDATPNTLMAKKREMFLLKQLKKEEESKRKRAEREREEERKKEETRIKQEEANVKREEDKLKRQHILDEYKKRKMEQEESQRMRDTGDIIATTKKHPKPHDNKKGHPYASSLAGSVSNVSEAGTAAHSETGSLRSLRAKRLSTGGRLEWETESASSSAVSADYNGPKLYKEPSSKSNKHIIHNAICHCCLPGKVNEIARSQALQAFEISEARHFMILFRDTKCQFRALYTYDPETEKLLKLYGNGPSCILPNMIDRLFKYNSGRKSFASLPSKTLSVSIDAVTIKNSIWQSNKRGNALKK